MYLGCSLTVLKLHLYSGDLQVGVWAGCSVCLKTN